MKYALIVGSVGQVMQTDDLAEAMEEFNAYCCFAKNSYGRCAGEPVVLMDGDEIIKEQPAGTRWEN